MNRSNREKFKGTSRAILLASLFLFVSCSKPSQAIKKLSSDDSDVRSGAIDALAKMGQPVVEPLIKVLAGDNSRRRSGAAIALGNIGDQRAVEPLISLLSDADKTVVEASIRALGNLKDPRAIPKLRLELYSSQAEDAAIALAKIGDEESIEYLVRMISPPSEYLGSSMSSLLINRRSIALALSAYGKAAVKPLLKSLDLATYKIFTDNYWVQKESKDAIIELVLYAPSAEHLLTALAAIGKPATDKLIASLKYDEEKERIKAAVALGMIRSPDAINPLIGAIKKARFHESYIEYTRSSSRYYYVLTHYMLALTSIGTPAAQKAIIQFEADRDFVIGKVAHALLVSTRPRSKIVESLVSTLEGDIGVAKERAAALLREITGATIAADQEKWKTWWENNRERIEKEDKEKEKPQG